LKPRLRREDELQRPRVHPCHHHRLSSLASAMYEPGRPQPSADQVQFLTPKQNEHGFGLYPR
jgi:hypothetical protein